MNKKKTNPKNDSNVQGFWLMVIESMSRIKCEKCHDTLLNCLCWIAEDVKKNPELWRVKKSKRGDIL